MRYYTPPPRPTARAPVSQKDYGCYGVWGMGYGTYPPYTSASNLVSLLETSLYLSRIYTSHDSSHSSAANIAMLCCAQKPTHTSLLGTNIGNRYTQTGTPHLPRAYKHTSHEEINKNKNKKIKEKEKGKEYMNPTKR